MVCILYGEKAVDQGLGIKLTDDITSDFGRPVCDVGRQEGGGSSPSLWVAGQVVKRMSLGLGSASPFLLGSGQITYPWSSVYPDLETSKKLLLHRG